MNTLLLVIVSTILLEAVQGIFHVMLFFSPDFFLGVLTKKFLSNFDFFFHICNFIFDRMTTSHCLSINRWEHMRVHVSWDYHKISLKLHLFFHDYILIVFL